MLVYMRFEKVGTGWKVGFSLDQMQSYLPKKLMFADPRKIMEAAERGHADSSLATKQGIDAGIRAGKGGVWLQLSQDQVRRLR